MMDDSARTSLARQKLREVFGFDDYRPLQQEIVESVLSGRDTVVVMPTGGGKSLCFQLPALVFEGLTVVVSPLISLMHDQVLHLDSYGARAVLLNSSLDRESYSANLAAWGRRSAVPGARDADEGQRAGPADVGAGGLPGD